MTIVVEATLLINDLDSNSSADIDMLLLSLAPTDYVDRPQTISDANKVRIFNDIAEEEMELLEEDILDLIAAGQN